MTNTARPIPLPKTLADVLHVLGWEEVTPRGDFGDERPFRLWCSPCLSARLCVYDRPRRPCVLTWNEELTWNEQDEDYYLARPMRDEGSFDFVIGWLTRLPTYLDAVEAWRRMCWRRRVVFR